MSQTERPAEQSPASGRGANGKFLPGNTVNLKHGMRSARFQAGMLPEQAVAAAAVRQLMEDVVADLGGEENVSALAASLIRTYARLSLHEEALVEHIERDGVMTTKGRVRAAVSLWLSIVDRKTRLAERLGLKRKARRVNALREAARSAEGRP